LPTGQTVRGAFSPPPPHRFQRKQKKRKKQQVRPKMKEEGMKAMRETQVGPGQFSED
jgi:hypothetical protein